MNGLNITSTNLSVNGLEEPRTLGAKDRREREGLRSPSGRLPWGRAHCDALQAHCKAHCKDGHCGSLVKVTKGEAGDRVSRIVQTVVSSQELLR